MNACTPFTFRHAVTAGNLCATYYDQSPIASINEMSVVRVHHGRIAFEAQLCQDYKSSVSCRSNVGSACKCGFERCARNWTRTTLIKYGVRDSTKSNQRSSMQASKQLLRIFSLLRKYFYTRQTTHQVTTISIQSTNCGDADAPSIHNMHQPRSNTWPHQHRNNQCPRVLLSAALVSKNTMWTTPPPKKSMFQSLVERSSRQ